MEAKKRGYVEVQQAIVTEPKVVVVMGVNM